jgi:glutathione synthase/RimK-type ligase-like ATP-grasp enzyme
VTVLILTRPNDERAWGRTAALLRERGADVHVLDTHRYPGELGLTWSGPGVGHLQLASGRVALAELRAIWCRRLEVGRGLPSSLPAGVRRAATAEATAVLLGALHDTSAFWLDPPVRFRRAMNKALQLRLARDLGITVPATLETNDPAQARAFIAALGRPVIAKMYTDARFQGGTVYTNVLGPDDVAALDALRACPMILQEAVPKHSELRVVVAGRRLFAVELPHDGLDAASRVDWRRTGGQTIDRWRPTQLEPELEARLQRFYDTLGLNYSLADLVRTPDGRTVLLESNAVGESFWVNDHHPLADALADVLLGVPGARRGEAA